jgi:hypothetical protein
MNQKKIFIFMPPCNEYFFVVNKIPGQVRDKFWLKNN